jgi:hypothetical protein
MKQLLNRFAVVVVLLVAVPGWAQAPVTPTPLPQPSAPEGAKPKVSFPPAETTSQPNTAPAVNASSAVVSPAIDAKPTAQQHKRMVRHRRPSRAVLAAGDEKLLKAKPERSDNATANAITKRLNAQELRHGTAPPSVTELYIQPVAQPSPPSGFRRLLTSRSLRRLPALVGARAAWIEVSAQAAITSVAQ